MVEHQRWCQSLQLDRSVNISYKLGSIGGILNGMWIMTEMGGRRGEVRSRERKERVGRIGVEKGKGNR